MNKVQLHFTWDNGIDASPYIYLINVDLLRADNLGEGKANAMRNELLNHIDSNTTFVESDLMNRISRSENEDDDVNYFDIDKYDIKDETKTITIQSWVEC